MVAEYGLDRVPLAAAVVAVIALPATWATRRLKVPLAAVGRSEIAATRLPSQTGL
ncbi:hypothetical protein [Streptomyces sp. NPDC059008]|uniref:hypothetical protein n=1 Tax=Streptomyces sp. NPDC059008 TaxID=3346693 RepID=UPI0036790E55